MPKYPDVVCRLAAPVVVLSLGVAAAMAGNVGGQNYATWKQASQHFKSGFAYATQIHLMSICDGYESVPAV